MENPTPKKGGMESRRVPRVPLVTKIRMKISRRMRGQIALMEETILGETIDISTLGVGVYCPVFLPKGVKLNAKISTAIFGAKDKTHLAFVGVVMNGRMAGGRTDYRLGIEFVRIAKRNQKLIDAYLKKNLS